MSLGAGRLQPLSCRTLQDKIDDWIIHRQLVLHGHQRHPKAPTPYRAPLILRNDHLLEYVHAAIGSVIGFGSR